MSLEQLKTLRNRRMEQSFIELQTQRQALEVCQDHMQQKQQQLVAFQQWRIEHQERLFTELKNQICDPQAVFAYRNTLEQLQQQEEQLNKELASTHQELQVAESRVEEARRHSAQANVKLEKLKEIIQVQQTAQKHHEESAQ